MSEHGRHLSTAIFLQHLSTRIAIAYPYAGSPAAELVVDGEIPNLTLRIDTDDAVPAGLNALKHVRVAEAWKAGGRRLTVTVTGPELMLDGHAMLCAIVDRVQIEGIAPADAVRQTLEQWRSVLAVRARLSHEAEVGLVGELMMLEAFAHALGDDALDAWRGAQREEHDFGLEALDVEVKTTSAERRAHWISSLTQLSPTPGRALTLVSLQITRGGQVGSTLRELVARVRAAFSDVERVNTFLRKADWDDDAADLFVDRWTLRTRPAAFEVTPDFPSITPQDLHALGAGTTAITEIHYRIDLQGREQDVPSGVLHTALTWLSGPGEEDDE